MTELANPVPGHFKIRLRRGGPYVAARISRECHCTVNGGNENAAHEWRSTCDRYPPMFAEADGRYTDVERVWVYGTPIPEAEYRYLMANADWARAYAPHLPAARPNETIDLNKTPPIF